jgi:hypothetical protein
MCAAAGRWLASASSLAALCLALAACGAPPPPAIATGPLAQPTGWKALLIAGDNEEPAFDNAVDAMAGKLESFGVPASDITILKASGRGTEAATKDNVVRAFDSLDPSPGQGCFVFVTSHGAQNEGLIIRSADAFLAPDGMAGLLESPGRNRPTVIIASGCYSGIFAEGDSLPAPNRVILTAARDDRTSFGCNAKREYTVFDQCVLGHLQQGARWQGAMLAIRACVAANEQELGVEAASSPQISAGADVADLQVF